MKFGEYIRKAREAKGWTQPEATKRIEIEQSYLSKLENGHNFPAEDVFERLISVYEIDTKHLMQCIQSSELEKLKEVTLIRKLLIEREQGQITSLRRWLLTGFAMLMLGSGLLTYELTKEPEPVKLYHYHSHGIIPEHEPDDFFLHEKGKTTSKVALIKQSDDLKLQIDISSEPDASKQAELDLVLSQIALLEKETRYIRSHWNGSNIHIFDNKGASFIQPDVGGRRLFSYKNTLEHEVLDRSRLLLAISSTLMVGGLASFFVARRWR